MMRPASGSPVLLVAVASHGLRAATASVDALSALPGVVWQVFWQGAVADASVVTDIQAVSRPDIAVTALQGSGVARSRNAALDHAAAASVPILLFADDDIRFATDAYPALVARFDADPALDFVCARLVNPDGRLHKRYSPDGTPARLWNCGKVGTPELALRPDRFAAVGLRFDTGFGAGAAVPVGDEFIFLADALKAGLRGLHIDLVVGEHAPESSDLRRGDQETVWRRKVFRRALGPVVGALAFAAWRLRDALRRLTAR